VYALVKQGAQVNIKTNLGETALSMAKQNNYNEIISILVQAGAN